MRRRTVPPVEALLADLDAAGVADAPREAPDATQLQGLLDLALFVAESKKSVAFLGFSWTRPRFYATDARIALRFAHAELGDDPAASILALAQDAADERTLLAIDARRSGVREFDLGHVLYGEPTLFAFPHKPAESADPRIHDAREAGWTPTLKTHNLLPGRGIVVLDEHQGLLLRDDRLAGILGFLVLFENGHTALWWNPFARGADAELQYWTAWGDGTAPASAWKQVFEASED